MAVTALGRAGELVDVQVVQLTAGGLDDPTAVRPGVVGVALTQSETLSHLVSLLPHGGGAAPRTLQSVVRVGSCTHAEAMEHFSHMTNIVA